jgi:hypothetical protein
MLAEAFFSALELSVATIFHFKCRKKSTINLETAIKTLRSEHNAMPGRGENAE